MDYIKNFILDYMDYIVFNPFMFRDLRDKC